MFSREAACSLGRMHERKMQLALPGRPFDCFRASRSGDRRILCRSGVSNSGFWSSKIVKGSVGCFGRRSFWKHRKPERTEAVRYVALSDIATNIATNIVTTLNSIHSFHQVIIMNSIQKCKYGKVAAVAVFWVQPGPSENSLPFLPLVTNSTFGCSHFIFTLYVSIEFPSTCFIFACFLQYLFCLPFNFTDWMHPDRAFSPILEPQNLEIGKFYTVMWRILKLQSLERVGRGFTLP